MQFAHEARTYSLFCLLTVWSYSVFLKLSQGRKSTVVFWTLLNTAILYTHYLGFVVPAIQILALVMIGGINRNTIISIMLMLSGMLILYLPWIPILVTRLLQTTSNGTWVAPARAEDLYNSIWSFSNSPVNAVFFLAILLLWYIFIYLKKVTAGPFVKHITLWFFIPLLGMFLMSWSALPFNLPVFIDRYLIYFSPAFCVLIACAAADVLALIKLPRTGLVIPCIIMAISFNPNPDNKRDVAETIDKLKQIETPKTLILFAPANFHLNFAYYYDLEAFESIGKPSIYQNLDRLLREKNVYGLNTLEDLGEVDIYGFDRIIYLDAGSSFMWNNNGIKDSLQVIRKQISQEKFKDIFTLYEFE